METRERQHSHRTTSGGGSELFICFTSRPSSTSCAAAAAAAMRVPSSKSLMSPGRAAAPSLSSSLSRRLRSSGSVKGGEQSPMFPAGVTARKKGCAFEAAEPSSPKVTCIGQVRVKSKKKKNKCKAAAGAAMVRSRSQRRSGGEASFRRAVGGEGERECKPWGITVCEALRAFGSEINCFVPCRGGTGGRSLCSSSKSGCEEEKRTRSSCGAVFARWMMAVQEGEEGKGGEVVGLVVQESGRREVGLVVGKEEEEEEEEDDVKEEEEEVVVVMKKKVEVEVEVEVEVVDEGRGSVCVPPKNALLLMRCRSDPVRMAALATRFWGSPNSAKVGAEEVGQTGEEAEEEVEDGVRVETIAEEKEEDEKELALVEDKVGEEQEEEQEVCETTAGAEEQEEQQNKCEDFLEGNAEEEKPKDESFPVDSNESSSPAVPLKEEVKEKRRRSRAKDREMRRSRSSKEKERKRNSFTSEREARRHSFSTEREARRPSISMETERRQSWSFSVVREEKENKEERDPNPNKGLDSEKPCKVEGEKKRELPDCLLLMMYEPKLSMEVSKETWVCSTDFLQWRPKEVVPAGAAAAAAAAEETQDSVPPLSEEVEKKLFGAPDPAPVPAPAPVAYEPFVLTRCKSEPMRSSARLAPDACFWKSRHQPIGAAGVGF